MRPYCDPYNCARIGCLCTGCRLEAAWANLALGLALAGLCRSVVSHVAYIDAVCDIAPPRIAGKTADFDQPGREYTAGDSLGLKRNQ